MFTDQAAPEEGYMRGLVYLASPYTHSDKSVEEQRFEDTCIAAGRLLNLGHMIWSPIAHGHPIAMRCSLPTDFVFWRRYCEATLSKCDSLAVLMLDGWRESTGVQAEIIMAKIQGKTVEYLDPKEWLG